MVVVKIVVLQALYNLSDHQMERQLLDHGNTSRDVRADAAYQSQAILARLDLLGFRAHI